MKRLWTLCIMITLGVAGAGKLACADVKVIANPGVEATSATSAEIRAIFLQTKNSLGNGRVQPVMLKGSTCETFSRSYLGKSAIGLEAYYRGLVFSGTGAIPKVFTSEDQMIAYISRTAGAIGYVSGAAATNGVKVLEVK
jgi:hypothetical protein